MRRLFESLSMRRIYVLDVDSDNEDGSDINIL